MALVLQLAHIQVLKTRLITKTFKATSAQSLNMEASLIFIGFKLDKKIDYHIVHRKPKSQAYLNSPSLDNCSYRYIKK